jgi:hypothetical protein
MTTKFLMVLMTLGVACTGCTTLSLEEHTLSQIQSSADFRYSAALSCVAAVAAEPNALPSFGLLSNGSAHIQDTEMINANTVWTRVLGSFAAETTAVTASRSPNPSWTVDPVADYTQLAAIRSACQWILYGPDSISADFPGILDSPLQNTAPGPHFGVAERLRQLPCGWLHHGCLKDVPLCASYKAHHGDTWVWVTSEGMKGLADFTLVLLDIATIDVADDYEKSPPVLVTLWRYPIVYFLAKSSLETSKDGQAPPLRARLIKEDPITGMAVADALSKNVADKPPFKTKADFLNALRVALTGIGLTPDLLQKMEAIVVIAAEQPAPYSTNLTYQENRVIQPEHWREISSIIQLASQKMSTAPIDNIPWEEWSTPYHGTRTNVKAQGPDKTNKAETAAGGTPPSRSRLVPFDAQFLLNAEGISQGPTIRGGTISNMPPKNP